MSCLIHRQEKWILSAKKMALYAGYRYSRECLHFSMKRQQLNFWCRMEQKFIRDSLWQKCMAISGERTALNYLQRMSGIATYTHSVAELLKGTGIKLLDTRKTTPNNRIFEKYAVRIGGGNNHRYNLSDGVLLKDNHIGAAGGVKEAIAAAKEYAPFVRKIEVEVENLDMVKEAVEAGADIIMLDNMDTDALKEAIAYIDGRAEIEVSGNVTKENIARLTGLGVDYVSSGALTHSAPILDISLKNLHPVEN